MDSVKEVLILAHILVRSYGLKLKRLNNGFVSHKYTAFHFTKH